MPIFDRFRKKALPPEATEQIGVAGLKTQSGLVLEEFLTVLQGQKGIEVYREMGDNDAIVGAVLFVLRMWLRAATWSVQPADETPEAEAVAEYVEQCMEDMSHSWGSFTDAMFTAMPQFGWAYFEVVYKERHGDNERPGLASKYDDGRVGWRKFMLLPAETRERWAFDDDIGLRGMYQRQTTGQPKLIPIEKAVLFRTTTYKDNPEGKSALRTAYRAWWFKKRMEEIEGIGAERQMVGFPKVFVTPDVLTDPELSETKAMYEKLAADVKGDEQAGVVLPSVFDDHGNRLVDLELIASPGSLTYNTSEIIERWARHMAMSVLADVILLGHEKVGTQALAVEKSDLLDLALRSWLGDSAEVLSRHEVPRLLRLNAIPTTLSPTVVATPAQKVNMLAIVDAIAKLAASGAPLWPSQELAEYISEQTGIPIPDDLDPLIDVPLPDTEEPVEPTLPPPPTQEG